MNILCVCKVNAANEIEKWRPEKKTTTALKGTKVTCQKSRNEVKI